MSNGDIVIPPTDLTSATIEAVNLILSQLGLSPLDAILSLFSGKPKFDDTLAVIAAYQQSAYWPLHALASDMQIWVKNGAPISDSNPAVQASFGVAKQGTVESIQQLAGEQPGPGSPGYWTIFALIQGSWGASGYGEQQVLKYVKALDALTQVLIQQNTKPPPPPPPPPPPSPPPGGGGGGNGDLIQELIACLCDETSDECCTAVVAAIAKVAAQLAIIAKAVAFGGKGVGIPPPPIDLSGVVAALQALVAAVNAYPPALEACCAEINASLGNIAKAISSAPGADTKPVTDALNKIVDQGDVDQFIFNALQKEGLISPADLQTLQGLKWSDAVSYITASTPWRSIEKAGKTVEADYTALNNWLINFSAKADSWAAHEVRKGLTTERNVIQGILTPILDAIKNQLKPTGVKQIGQIGVNPDTVLADVAAVTFNLQTIATLISLAREGAGEQISKWAERIGAIIGFEELREVQLGPLVAFGMARIAEMQAKALFGQELPGAGALADLAARGLITNQQYFTWVPYTGLPGELWEQERQAAYRGLNARQMLRLIETNLFTSAEITDELTFTGMRPVSQARMEHAAPYLATQTERRSLISTLEKAYIAGLMADADLTGNIDSAENNTTRDNLILQRVKWEVLVTETKALEAEYTTLYFGQVIDDATFRGYLGGIGLQPWMISIAAAKAEARLNATLHRKELAAAAALQRATAAEERKAAVRNFTTGNVDAPALGIALVATGLTVTQAAAWVDLAVLQKAGGLRWKYGLQLPAPEATLLQQRVTALTDQRKRQQISDAQYVSALQALNIPPNYVNALRATADAMLTPAKTAFAIPVQTG
jgi:hypothetical protein